MFAKHHDTPYVTQPQLKEGAGGLRCLHCANWIRNSIGEQPARPSPEFDTVVCFRNLLHLRTGKHQDMFTRQRQEEIADQLGVDTFEMMSKLIESGAHLHRHYRRATEKLRESRFALSPSVTALMGEARVVGEANAGEAAVGIAIATRLGLAVRDLQVGPVTGVPGPAAVFALSTGEATLRNLDRCGLLSRILPELTDCRTLVSDDSLHNYTVFEHTLRVVRNLDSLEPGDFLGDLKEQVTDLEPLYLTALLHDIGKIDRTKNHTEFGAELAADLCRRWDLADGIGDTVVALVREHLTMAKFIRLRDVSNPQTSLELADIVEDVGRLHLLTLLTWADIAAVGPNAWTSAYDSFLKELHARTQARLQSDVRTAHDPALYRQRLLRQLKPQTSEQDQVQRFVESLPAHYLTVTPPDVVRLHMGFALKATEGRPTVEVYARHDLNATDITICTLDAPRLLTRLLGVLYAFDLSLVSIRACTTTTSPNVALDTFTVGFNGREVPQATLKRVSAALLAVLEGNEVVEELLESKGKDPYRVQPIHSYTYLEGSPGVLELEAPKGRGMPYRISRLIADCGWDIVSARIGQWAGRAAATFYLLRLDGEPLGREEIDRGLKEIRE